MKNNPVGWFEIYVEDMQRAKKFYEAVFDGKLERLDTDFEAWNFPQDLKTSGSAGALMKMPGVHPSGISTIVYFSSVDCSIEESRVVQNGGKIEKSKMSIGKYGFVTLARDTEGNMIGIHSLK